MTKSDMVIKLDKEQIETMIRVRDNFDYRMIHNIDMYAEKCVYFEKNKLHTEFINKNQNIK